MKRTIWAIAVLAFIATTATDSRAGLVIYNNDQAGFNAATSGLSLSTQSFAAASRAVGVGAGLPMDNPLDSSTDNGIFLPGDILPGLSISANPGLGSDLGVTGPDFGGTGLTNYAIFSNYFDTLTITFTTPQSAVSLGLLSLFSPSDVSVDIDGSSTTASDSAMGVPNTGSGQFFGVVATGGETITSITLTASLGNSPGIDSVQLSALTAVPEPSTFISGSVAALGALGYGWRRRRSSVTA